MNFEDIKKIVDKEGKVILIENEKTYIVSRYNTSLIEEKEKVRKSEEIQEDLDEPLKIEDLPF